MLVLSGHQKEHHPLLGSDKFEDQPIFSEAPRAAVLRLHGSLQGIRQLLSAVSKLVETAEFTGGPSHGLGCFLISPPKSLCFSAV